MNQLHPAVSVGISTVVAALLCSAILLSVPGLVSERLLFAGLLFPISTMGFTLYLHWQDSPKSALILLATIAGISALAILILNPLH